MLNKALTKLSTSFIREWKEINGPTKMKVNLLQC